MGYGRVVFLPVVHMLINRHIRDTAGRAIDKLFGDEMMKKEVLKYKGYDHFDVKKNPNKYISKVQNPCWVKKHGFYPFIHYNIVFEKYIDVNGVKEKKEKVRQIYYASHSDRYIYQYYANILNNQYTAYAKKIGINKAITAYRSNFKGKNNIHFAKEVFEFIANQEYAIVYVGDFSDFFDNLDHKHLKKCLNKVQDKERLSDDWYKIFKNITSYSFIDKEDIESNIDKRFIKKNSKKEQSSVGNEERLDKYFDTKKFQEIKKQYLKKNTNDYGIPQGSAISAVYSNVYMLDFDKTVTNAISSRGGLYRRYSDDFIIVLPYTGQEERKDNTRLLIEDIVKGAVQITPNLNLHKDKTDFFCYSYSDKSFVDSAGYSVLLDYLGFSFDGRKVKLREKTLFKYYSRAYSKVKVVNSFRGKKQYYAVKKKLYQLYTHLGDYKYSNKLGNFITYARKSHEIMSSSDKLDSRIYNQYCKHWDKINKRLK